MAQMEREQCQVRVIRERHMAAKESLVGIAVFNSRIKHLEPIERQATTVDEHALEPAHHVAVNELLLGDEKEIDDPAEQVGLDVRGYHQPGHGLHLIFVEGCQADFYSLGVEYAV